MNKISKIKADLRIREWAEIVRECSRSGLTIREWCGDRESESTFFNCKRQMIHTFTPSNQHVTIGSGGDANETFTGRVERNH